jgi:hypothetical protein
VRLLHQQLNRYRQHAQQVYGVAMTTSKKSGARTAASGRDPRHFVETRLRYEATAQAPQRTECLSSGAPETASGPVEVKLTHWSNRARMRSALTVAPVRVDPA